MEGKQLVKFEIYLRPKTSMLLYINSELSQHNLKGDFLSKPPTLDDCYWYMKSAVDKYATQTAYKYHNPVHVIREQNRIILRVVGIATEKKTDIAGFELIENQA